MRAHGVEGIALEALEAGRKPRHDPEGEQNGDRADMGDQAGRERPPAGSLPFSSSYMTKKVGRGGHQLPGDQEEEGIVRQDHQEHAGEKERSKRLIICVIERWPPYPLT